MRGDEETRLFLTVWLTKIGSGKARTVFAKGFLGEGELANPEVSRGASFNTMLCEWPFRPLKNGIPMA